MKKHSDRQPNDVSNCLNNKSIYQQMKLANPSLPPSKFANQFNPVFFRFHLNLTQLLESKASKSVQENAMDIITLYNISMSNLERNLQPSSCFWKIQDLLPLNWAEEQKPSFS